MEFFKMFKTQADAKFKCISDLQVDVELSGYKCIGASTSQAFLIGYQIWR